jgi:hypothetical protein
LPSRNHASRPWAPAPDDLVRVELKRHLLRRLALGQLRVLVLTPQFSPGPAKELTPALRGAQLLGQLITTRLAERFVLGLVGRPGLRQDLARDLLEAVVDLRARVARDPGAIDRHHPGLHQPRPITQLEHLGEQLDQRPLVATDKARDRRVIGNQVAGDQPVSDVLAAVTLDRPRRPHPRRERVQDQRHHQRRLIRRATVTVSPIRGIKRRQVHLADRVDHKPRQVIRRQPLPDVRRQQEPLLTAAFNEVLRHTEMLLTRPDGPLYATASVPCGYLLRRSTDARLSCIAAARCGRVRRPKTCCSPLIGAARWAMKVLCWSLVASQLA